MHVLQKRGVILQEMWRKLKPRKRMRYEKQILYIQKQENNKKLQRAAAETIMVIIQYIGVLNNYK